MQGHNDKGQSIISIVFSPALKGDTKPELPKAVKTNIHQKVTFVEFAY